VPYAFTPATPNVYKNGYLTTRWMWRWVAAERLAMLNRSLAAMFGIDLDAALLSEGRRWTAAVNRSTRATEVCDHSINAASYDAAKAEVAKADGQARGHRLQILTTRAHTQAGCSLKRRVIAECSDGLAAMDIYIAETASTGDASGQAMAYSLARDLIAMHQLEADVVDHRRMMKP
jgi:hypothetical protein